MCFWCPSRQQTKSTCSRTPEPFSSAPDEAALSLQSFQPPAAARRLPRLPPGSCSLSARSAALRVSVEPRGYSDTTDSSTAVLTSNQNLLRRGRTADCEGHRGAHQIGQVVLMDHLRSCEHGQHAGAHHPQVPGPRHTCRHSDSLDPQPVRRIWTRETSRVTHKLYQLHEEL